MSKIIWLTWCVLNGVRRPGKMPRKGAEVQAWAEMRGLGTGMWADRINIVPLQNRSFLGLILVANLADGRVEGYKLEKSRYH